MPFLEVQSNLNLSNTEKENCLQTLSKAVAELLDKSESYVMTSWVTCRLTMAGTQHPAVFVDLRSIRLPDDAPERMAPELCQRINLTTGVQADRIYLNFTDIPPGNWGWNGKTFAT